MKVVEPKTKYILFGVIFIYILIYILPLGVRPIVIPDETRYGEISREMIQTGDWVVPRLDGLRYFEKPIMGYWLNSVSMLIFGENAFSIRLISALSVGISAFLVFFLLLRTYKDYFTAGLGAFILYSFFEVFGVGVFSVLDSSFSMLITVAMFFFFISYNQKNIIKKHILLSLFGLFCGFSFLAKGFISFAIPVITIIPFLIWDKQLKRLFKDFWIPIIISFLTILPWAILIYLKESDFWNYFFWVQHIERFVSAAHQHPEPFWYYAAFILPCALPWTFLFPASISGISKDCLSNKLIKYSICWFLFPLLFFSASSGKILTYILPCFPPLAILVTVGLVNFSKNHKKEKILSILIGIFATIVAIGTVLFAINHFIPIFEHRLYNQDETIKFVLSVFSLLFFSIMLFVSAKEKDFYKKIIWFCIAPICFMFFIHFIIPQNIIDTKAPGDFYLSKKNLIKPTDIVVSTEKTIGAACWFFQRDDVYLLNFNNQGNELEYGLSYDDSKYRKLVLNKLNKMIKEKVKGQKLFTVTTLEKFKQHNFSKPIKFYNNGDFVIAQY